MSLSRRYVVVALAGLLALTAAPATASGPLGTSAGGSSQGYAIADFHGLMRQYYIPEPGNKNFGQEWLEVYFDAVEEARITAHGLIPHSRPDVMITGSVQSSYAPPNAGLSCSGVLSPRPGAPDLFSWSDAEVVGSAPLDPRFVQSTGAPGSSCAGGGDVGGDPFPAGAAELAFTRSAVQICSYATGCPERGPVRVAIPTNTSLFVATMELHRLAVVKGADKDMFNWLLDAISADVLIPTGRLRTHGSASVPIPKLLWNSLPSLKLFATVDAGSTVEASASASGVPIRSVRLALTSAGRALLLGRSLQSPTIFRVRMSGTVGTQWQALSQSVTVPS